MITSGPDALLISDFNKKVIGSIKYARSNKDPVFCSIFYMNEIANICDSYKLKFGHNIQILPELKIARILGTMSKVLILRGRNHQDHIRQDPNVVEQHRKGLVILQAEINRDN